MFDSINRKKAVQVLLIVMVASALLAGIIFVVQFGPSGFSIFSSDSSYKNNVDEEKNSAADGIQTLTVRSTSENINIIPDDSSEIRAHFYGSYASSDKTFKPKLVMEKEGSNLIISIDNGNKKLTLTYLSDLKLDVYVPETFNKKFNITSTSGEITAENIKAESLAIRTTSGMIAAKAIDTAGAAVGSTSGKIEIDGSFGDLEIDSTSGAIVSENLTAVETKINSTSGEIKLKGSIDGVTAGATSGTVVIDTDKLTKDMAISTTSGEIIVKLPSDAGFTLGAKSQSGEINCAFPVTVSGDKKHNSLNGTVGNGRCNIALSSTSGNINIAK
ncbi:MAG TPA: DUF4097 family beta strand repeat-containing protein [Clostridia bacterium]|nr:DUF4097 family beta strand repeat-containing protein [Clostridia bacterium]